MEQKVNVIFIVLSYEIDKELIEKMKVDNDILNQVAEEYAIETQQEGKEVFKVDKNIIYTEEGYVVLVLEEWQRRIQEYRQMMYN